jgi:glutamine synthetase
MKKIGKLLNSAYKNVAKLEVATNKAGSLDDTVKMAASFRDKVKPVLEALRADIDALEEMVSREQWPVPVYSDLLFKL